VDLHNRENAVTETSGKVRPRVPRERPESDSDLAIAEDLDFGCDPYNSTGRHVIMKPKIELED
jgi:hypothetical protein